MCFLWIICLMMYLPNCDLGYSLLVDIARYQSNFSEYEGKSLKKEWKIWIRGAAEDSYFSRFLRTFSWIFWKVTRMSAISDKQHNQTELSMLRCSLQLAIVNNLRNCELFEIKSQFLKLFTIASSIWIKTASVTVTISTWACCFRIKYLNKETVTWQ